VVLTFALVSLLALGLNVLTNGKANLLLFSVYRSSWKNPLTYLRFFGHVLGHSGWDHYTGNILMILVIGPMLEEKYGSRNLLEMIALTAVVSGVMHVILFPNAALLGASGIVYMMILLSSLASMKENRIPLTLILVAAIYLGGEVISGLTVSDNISHLTHVVGGVCGAIFGLTSNHGNRRK
jgi:membrane associated rhomboid family serine protease